MSLAHTSQPHHLARLLLRVQLHDARQSCREDQPHLLPSHLQNGMSQLHMRRLFLVLTMQFVALFLSADVFSLILQAVGGGWAASSEFPVPDAASNLMLAGIAFQLAIMIIFVFIGADFCFRIATHRPYGVRVNKLAAGNGATGENLELGQVTESRRTSETHLKGAGVGTNGQTWEGMSRRWWLLMFAMLISSLAIIVRGE